MDKDVAAVVAAYNDAAGQGNGTAAAGYEKELARRGLTVKGKPAASSESKPAAAESRRAAAVADDAPASEAPRGRTAPRDRQQKA